MLPVTNAFRENIYAAERQILARATININAFGEESPIPVSALKGNLVGKVSGSVVENPHKFKSASFSSLYSPTNAAWVEQTTGEYTNVSVLNGTTSDKANSAVGNRGLHLFSFDIIQMLERQYGTQIWSAVETLAEKVTLAKSFLTNITLNWHGSGVKPSPTFTGFRYIRDWINGNTINPSNHWLEVQCLAGATNRCSAKTPTSNHVLTNPTYATDGNTTGTYASDASNTGAAYLQIDLGAVYSDIDTIKVWHYYADGRTYNGTKTEVSVDGVTWTTLRDSAVSGTYLETSGGLILKPMTSANQCGLATWQGTQYDSWNGHSSASITKLTNSWTDANLVIDSNGFFHCCAYSEISNVSGNLSKIKTDYVELLLTGTIRITTRVYDNTKILRWNALEEINVLNESLPSNEASITLDNADGEFNILTYGNMYDVLASKPTVFIEAGLVTDVSAQTVEWIPCGKYFITEWKNDLANRIISFTGHDYFFMLGDTSYGPTPTNVANNLLALANDILDIGGVPTADRILDGKLSAITTAGKITDRTDCRTALQNIAIAAQLCIFQDRLGNVVMKPFASIDKLSNFLLYTRNPSATPTNQLSVIGNYAGPNTFSVISTGSGMRFIDYDAMFDYPEIELTSNIYQLIIKVYFSTTDPDTLEVSWDSRETVHNNPHITGNTGISFTIDNPLVLTDNMANEIADWYFDESLYNANFRANWRQNPAIECTDMVLIEDPFHSNKQTRVYRQEFNYEGYLEGTTESRGGI